MKGMLSNHIDLTTGFTFFLIIIMISSGFMTLGVQGAGATVTLDLPNSVQASSTVSGTLSVSGLGEYPMANVYIERKVGTSWVSVTSFFMDLMFMGFIFTSPSASGTYEYRARVVKSPSTYYSNRESMTVTSPPSPTLGVLLSASPNEVYFAEYATFTVTVSGSGSILSNSNNKLIYRVPGGTWYTLYQVVPIVGTNTYTLQMNNAGIHEYRFQIHNSGYGIVYSNIITVTTIDNRINFDDRLFSRITYSQNYITETTIIDKKAAYFDKASHKHAQLRTEVEGFASTPFEATALFMKTRLYSYSWAPGITIQYPESELRFVFYARAGNRVVYGYPGYETMVTSNPFLNNIWYELRISTYQTTSTAWFVDIAYRQMGSSSWSYYLENYAISAPPDEDPLFTVGTTRTDFHTSNGHGDKYYFADAQFKNNQDRDHDGLTDIEELFYRNEGIMVDIDNPDTDGDGLLDGVELDTDVSVRQQTILSLDPDDKDRVNTSDLSHTWVQEASYDYFLVDEYVSFYSNPVLPDSDFDGLTDSEEKSKNSSPMLPDTDGDGINDLNDWYPTIVDTQAPAFLDISDQVFQQIDGTIISVPGAYYSRYTMNDLTLSDESYNSRHGMQHGIIIGQGMSHQAAYFGGDGDYIDLPDISADEFDYEIGFSVSTWVKFQGLGDWERIFDFGNGAASDNILLARHQSTDDLTFEVYSGLVTGGKVTIPDVIVQNQWMHITVSLYSNGTHGIASIYINGALVGEGTTGVPHNVNRAGVYIGRSNWLYDAFFNGAIDEFHIYDFALNKFQVSEIYLKSSLLIHYRMDSIDPTILEVDNSKNSMHATVHEATYTPGIQNAAMEFDGTNDYLSTPNVLTPYEFTLSLWAKSDTSNWNSNGMLASKRNSFILHPVASTKDIRFYVHLGGQWKSIQATVDDITKWHHYAASYDINGDLKLYIDGVLVASNNYPGSLTLDSGPMIIGADDGYINSRHFDGLIDDVRLYTFNLEEHDIVWIFRGSASEFEEISTYAEMIGTDLYVVFQLADNSGISNLTSTRTALGITLSLNYTLTEIYEFVPFILKYPEPLADLTVELTITDVNGYRTDPLTFFIPSGLSKAIVNAIDFVMTGADWILDQIFGEGDWLTTLGDAALEASREWIDALLPVVSLATAAIVKPHLETVSEQFRSAYTQFIYFVNNYDGEMPTLESFLPDFLITLKDTFEPIFDLVSLFSKPVGILMDVVTGMSVSSYALEAISLLGTSIFNGVSNVGNYIDPVQPAEVLATGKIDLMDEVVSFESRSLSDSSLPVPDSQKMKDLWDDLKVYLDLPPFVVSLIDIAMVELDKGHYFEVAFHTLLIFLFDVLIFELFDTVFNYWEDSLPGNANRASSASLWGITAFAVAFDAFSWVTYFASTGLEYIYDDADTDIINLLGIATGLFADLISFTVIADEISNTAGPDVRTPYKGESRKMILVNMFNTVMSTLEVIISAVQLALD